MKIKITIMLILISGCWSFLPAQYLINKGADIVISSGSSLVINGNFENQLDGSLGNSGNVLITGNFTNNQSSGTLLSGTTGTVRLVGSVPQTIAGTAITYFSNLNLQNNAVLAGNTVAVSTSLTLTNKFLTLGNTLLVVQNGAPIVGAGSSGYIISNGTGFLRQYVTASNRVFPIGTSSAFTPVTLNNAGTADYYSARVFPDVRVSGLTGATIPQINDCVNITWDIAENVAGGSNLSVTPSWGAALEGPSFSRAHCGVGHFTGGSWDGQTEGAASGTNPYSITRSGITSLSAFAVGDLESPMAIPVDIRLSSVAYLEGPFNGATMNINLKNAGLIPLNQPFNEYPWFYAGTESVVSVPPNTVDWILLELRDATSAAAATGATAFARKAAFLKNDGSIVDLDGSTIPTFTGTVTNNLYVVVYHRNHLPIMSANAVTPTGGIYYYNFSTSVGQVYGGANGHKLLGGGKWGMFSGNGDGDKFIVIADRDNVWDPQSGTYGYKDGDFNMNTQVNNVDKDDHWVVNTGKSSQVPN